MTDAPELPTLFRHGSGVYDLVPDVRPLTWSLWIEMAASGRSP